MYKRQRRTRVSADKFRYLVHVFFNHPWVSMPPPIVLGLGYGLGLNIKHPTDCAIQALLLLKCAFVEKTNKYFEVRNDVRI